MRCLARSATNTFAPASTAMPQGPLKEAAEPTPSEDPSTSLPANVETVHSTAGGGPAAEEGVAELVPEEEGDSDAEALPEADAVALADAVGEGAQKGSSVEPAAQDGVHTQGAHVSMDDAPSAGEKVPAGHSVGSTEDRGQ
jgi:hypothetical protein